MWFRFCLSQLRCTYDENYRCLHSLWENLKNRQCIKYLCPTVLYCQKYCCQIFMTKHPWLVHSLYGQKYWDTPFFRREKGTSKLATKLKLKIVFPPLLQQFWSVWNDCTHMYKSLVFGDEFLAQDLYLKSLQRCSAGIRTWLSADQSSSSTLTESSFLFDPCLIHRDTVMLE